MAGFGSSGIARKYGMDIAIMVSVSFGSDCHYLAPVLHIGGSFPYKNQNLWVRLDKEDLFCQTSDGDDIYGFKVIRKKPGDQFLILPALDRFWEKLSPHARAVCMENIKYIQDDSDSRFSNTVQFHRDFKFPVVPDIDPDADLYQGGFFSYQDKREIDLFHQALAQDKNRDKHQVVSALQGRRVRTLAQRILVRNFGEKVERVPEFLSHLKWLAGAVSDKAVRGYREDTKVDLRRCPGIA